MPGGRPSKYTPEIVAQAKEYIENYKEYDHIIPSIVGMAVVLGVHKSTLLDWSKDESKEFSAILETCRNNSEFALVNGSLGNDLNSNIAKLCLGKFGYHEKMDTTNRNVELTHEEWLNTLDD